MNFSLYDNNDNNSNDKLDALAREINEKKNSYELLKTVHNEFYNESQKNKKQLNDALDSNIHGFSNFMLPNKNTQNPSCDTPISGDTFINKLNTHKNSESYDSSSSSKNNSDDTNFTAKSIIKKLKNVHNKHITDESDSIVSNDYGSIIKHLKKCKKCKSKIKLVFNDNHGKKNKTEKGITINLGDMKESLMTVLIVVLIFFVIFMIFRFR